MELKSCTSEVRDSKGNFFSFADLHGNEGTTRECPDCLQYEFQHKLRPRILMKDEVKLPDYDNWLQYTNVETYTQFT